MKWLFECRASVPELTDLSQETAETFALYGEQVETPGSFAACCLQARRLVERGVRNIQIFHRGWDAHRSFANGARVTVSRY